MAASGAGRAALGRNEAALAAMLAAVLGAFVLATFQGWSYDDPYITYRYALNARQGVGLVYNAGEAVLSTTSPLFALVLGAFVTPVLDLQQVAAVIGATGMAAGGLALFVFARRAGLRVGAWACLALYAIFPLVAVTMSSETPLYLALCLWAFAAAAWGKALPAGMLAGAAVFARGDGALAALMAGAMLVAVDRGRGRTAMLAAAGRFAAGLLAVLAPWLAFATATYGSPIPATLAAKQAQGAMEISTSFAAGLPVVLSWYASGAGFVAQFAVAVAGLARALVRARLMLWLVAWSAAYFAAYTWLGVSGYFWYYAPLAVGFVAAVGSGIDALGALRCSRWDGVRTAAAAAVAMGLLAVQAVDLTAVSRLTDGRVRIYRAAGEWLAQNTSPSATVGALEIGVIGLYSGRRVVDFAGLVQPAVAARLGASATYDAAAVWAAEHYRPEYVVVIDGALPRFEREYAASWCAPVHMLRAEDFGATQNVRIVSCRH